MSGGLGSLTYQNTVVEQVKWPRPRSRDLIKRRKQDWFECYEEEIRRECKKASKEDPQHFNKEDEYNPSLSYTFCGSPFINFPIPRCLLLRHGLLKKQKTLKACHGLPSAWLNAHGSEEKPGIINVKNLFGLAWLENIGADDNFSFGSHFRLSSRQVRCSKKSSLEKWRGEFLCIRWTG